MSVIVSPWHSLSVLCAHTYSAHVSVFPCVLCLASLGIPDDPLGWELSECGNEGQGMGNWPSEHCALPGEWGGGVGIGGCDCV